MKLIKVNDTGGKTYVTIQADNEGEKIVLVLDGSKIIELKGTNLIIKDKKIGDIDDDL